MQESAILTLLVARHGNTFGPSDVVRRVGCRTDLPLVSSGIDQARQLGIYLKAQQLVPSLIFTSTLKRTIQTAEYAMQAMSIRCQTVSIEFLNEIDYGPDENQPEDKVISRLGQAALSNWELNNQVPPGWRVDVAKLQESWRSFGAQLATHHDGQMVLCVTSSGIARFSPVLTDDFDNFRSHHSLKLSTGAFSHFHHADNRWECVAWNVRPSP